MYVPTSDPQNAAASHGEALTKNSDSMLRNPFANTAATKTSIPEQRGIPRRSTPNGGNEAQDYQQESELPDNLEQGREDAP